MVLTTLTVSLSAYTVPVGQSATATAAGFDQKGGAIATGTVTWSSSAPTVATVSANGSITALAAGQSSITGAAGTKSGQQLLTVIPVPVASVAVSPANVQMVLGSTQQLSAVPRDANNVALTGRTVAWSSSDSSKVRVSSAGLVTAVAVGFATISAVSEGRTGTATISVIVPLFSGFGNERFVRIPSGSFQMGSIVDASSEGPIHSVTISRAFYFQKTALTREQWLNVMGADPSAWSSCGSSSPVDNASRVNAGLSTHAVALRAPTAWRLYDTWRRLPIGTVRTRVTWRPTPLDRRPERSACCAAAPIAIARVSARPSVADLNERVADRTSALAW